MRKVLSLMLVCMLVLNLFSTSEVVFGQEVTKNRLDVVAVSSSGDDGNIVENTIDNIDSTRWSAKNESGNGQWALYDLGEVKDLANVGMAFYSGDIRYTELQIEVSTDGETWTTAYEKGHTDEASLDIIRFDIEDTTARYIKITGFGYAYFEIDPATGLSVKESSWVSIVDVHFYASDADELDVMQTIEPEVADTSLVYTEPGMINPDGSVHEEHTANVATNTLNVLDLGVVADGSDQSAAIQAVIDSASAGDEVYLPGGTYGITKELILNTGINLRGDGVEETILMALTTDGAYSSSVIVMYGKSDIMISDLRVTSEFTGAYSTDHQTNNPEASGPNYPIAIKDFNVTEEALTYDNPSSNITIDNLLIENYQTMGIRVENSHDVVIKNSTFQKATDVGGGGAGYGVSIQGDGNNVNRVGFKNDSRYNVVRDCDFVGPYLRHGVILQYYTHNNAIYDNTLTATKLDAIDIHGEDEYLNEIYNNVIADIETGAGIAAGNTGATHDKSGPGNYIHDNTISNSREGIKIHLGTEDTVIKNNTITGATVDNAKGIYLQNAPGTVVEGNIIMDNESPDFYSVYVSYDPGTNSNGFGTPRDITIEDNEFENNTNGIFVSSGVDMHINNNTYVDIAGEEMTDTRNASYKGNLLPSDILDLTNWKITLPIVDAEDGEGAEEIKQPDLDSYTDEFFYVNEEQTAVVFNAPVDADGTSSTTTNSSYPRSELREMASNGLAQASWSTTEGKHTMVIDEMITNLPRVKDEVVVGQIHDHLDDVIMIRLEGEKLFVQAEGTDLGTLNSDYQLGTRFQVKIEVENDIIAIYYNDTLKVEYEVVKTGCYFKAGMYTQSNLSKGDEADAYGEVQIFDVTVTHEESVEPLPEILIPDAEASGSASLNMDTFFELKKDVPDETPNNTNSQLEVKTSSKEDYIRFGVFEFDLTSYDDDIYASELLINKKSADADMSVSVYATSEKIQEDGAWLDILEATDKISVGNTGVKDWLSSIDASKVGEMDFTGTNADANLDIMEHTFNTSEYLNNDYDADSITFILIDEDGVNLYLKLHSMESDYPAELNMWNTTHTPDDVVEPGDGDEEPGDEEPVDDGSDIDLSTDADIILQANMDTYLELPNAESDDVMEVKLSSGQTTIRMGIISFDTSDITATTASALSVTTDEIDQDTALSVYGTTMAFVDDLVWTDILPADGRYDKDGHTEVRDWLAANGTLIGTIDTLTTETSYSIDTSAFMAANTGEEEVSFIIIDETKSGKSFEVYSSDADEVNRPVLDVDGALLSPARDTFVELPYNDKVTVKMSGGQSTLRLSLFEFDLSGSTILDNGEAIFDFFTDKDSKALNISIYATTENFDDDVTWKDQLSVDDRFPEVSAWLASLENSAKITEIPLVKATGEGLEGYGVLVTDFLEANKEADTVTFIMLDETGANADAYICSMEESTAAFRPTLSLWNPLPVLVEAQEASVMVAAEPVMFSTSNLNTGDITLVDDALDLLTYELFADLSADVTLPSEIGSGVNVSWSSENPDVISNSGVIDPAEFDTDVTIVATLTLGDEVTTKEFVVVVEGDGIAEVPASSGSSGSSSSNDDDDDDEDLVDEELAESIAAFTALTDLHKAPWAFNAIKDLYERGIAEGVGNATYEPLESVDRAEFVKLLVEALEVYDKDATTTFSDVAVGEWYYSYIGSAQQEAIVNGLLDGSFAPLKDITRQDMALIIYNGLVSTGTELTLATDVEAFADQDYISAYALEAVQTLKAAGMVSGKGNNDFDPLGKATRAEAAVIIYNLLQNIEAE